MPPLHHVLSFAVTVEQTAQGIHAACLRCGKNLTETDYTGRWFAEACEPRRPA